MPKVRIDSEFNTQGIRAGVDQATRALGPLERSARDAVRGVDNITASVTRLGASSRTVGVLEGAVNGLSRAWRGASSAVMEYATRAQRAPLSTPFDPATQRFRDASTGRFTAAPGAGAPALPMSVAGTLAAGYAVQQFVSQGIDLARDRNRADLFLRSASRQTGTGLAENLAFAERFGEEVGLGGTNARSVTAQALRVTNMAGMGGKAPEFVRALADAATAAGRPLSELDTLMTQVATGQDEVFDKLLSVNPSSLYDAWAKANNRTAASLSDVEKLQIRVNAVIKAGADNIGEAAKQLDTAAGRWDNFWRKVDERKMNVGEDALTILTGSEMSQRQRDAAIDSAVGPAGDSLRREREERLRYEALIARARGISAEQIRVAAINAEGRAVARGGNQFTSNQALGAWLAGQGAMTPEQQVAWERQGAAGFEEFNRRTVGEYEDAMAEHRRRGALVGAMKREMRGLRTLGDPRGDIIRQTDDRIRDFEDRYGEESPESVIEARKLIVSEGTRRLNQLARQQRDASAMVVARSGLDSAAAGRYGTNGFVNLLADAAFNEQRFSEQLNDMNLPPGMRAQMLSRYRANESARVQRARGELEFQNAQEILSVQNARNAIRGVTQGGPDVGPDELMFLGAMGLDSARGFANMSPEQVQARRRALAFALRDGRVNLDDLSQWQRELGQDVLAEYEAELKAAPDAASAAVVTAISTLQDFLKKAFNLDADGKMDVGGLINIAVEDADDKVQSVTATNQRNIALVGDTFSNF
jgi:hypothetical protein